MATSVLKRGSKGSDVRELQAALNRAGANPPLEVDGEFGPLTEAVVKSFQAAVNLPVDGIAGPQTIAALLAVNDKKTAQEATQASSSKKKLLWGAGALLTAAVIASLA
jgi:peptidoglycan hydrolase-like protein with peptidoglycan-binding domain